VQHQNIIGKPEIVDIIRPRLYSAISYRKLAPLRGLPSRRGFSLSPREQIGAGLADAQKRLRVVAQFEIYLLNI
jgi:hypothetical protein